MMEGAADQGHVDGPAAGPASSSSASSSSSRGARSRDGSSITEKKAADGKNGTAEIGRRRIDKRDQTGIEIVTISASFLSACKWLTVLICLSLFMVTICWELSWKLPAPKSAQQAGLTGFSEQRAMKHLEAMVAIGPRPLGTKALDSAVEYVMEELRKVQKECAPGVVVDLDLQKVEPSGMRLHSGLFAGRAHAYAGMSNVVCRIRGESWVDGPESHSILVSAHLDTVIESPGAGDDASAAATMIEVARALTNRPPAKHAVIFLLNSGEENGLLGAHGFITQHPWRFSLRATIDLEAMGVGGRSILFQAAPDGWLVRKFAEVAPYPDAQIVPQDVFQSGVINAATDFQVYTEIADLPSLDFAYMENAVVYHTKHDNLKLYRAGSMQHSGDNILALVHAVTSSHAFEQQRNVSWKTAAKDERPVFFALGKSMVILSTASARKLYLSGIIASLFLLFIVPICRRMRSGKSQLHPGGNHLVTWKVGLHVLGSLALSLLTVIFAVLGAVSAAVTSAILITLPGVSYHSMPFVAHPWLLIGLFGAPALAGGLIGHKAGQIFLLHYLKWIGLGRKRPAIVYQAERWLFKGGLLFWVVILIVAERNSLGSAILAFLFMVAPMFAYLLVEGDDESWDTGGPGTGLRWLTAALALVGPILVTAMPALRLPAVLVGSFTAIDRNPGGVPILMPSLVFAILIALLVSGFLIYLFPYAHRQGAWLWLIGFSLIITAASFFTVQQQLLPSFSDTFTRKVNVVHYFDVDKSTGFVTLYSQTPGSLDKEVERMHVAGLSCKKNMAIDFIHFKVSYGCTKETEFYAQPFEKSTVRLPKLEFLASDGSSSARRDNEPIYVLVDAGGSARWAIAMNSDIVANYSLAIYKEHHEEEEEVIESKRLGHIMDEAGEGKVMFYQTAATPTAHGWHILNFVSAHGGPSRFTLMLHPHEGWRHSSNSDKSMVDGSGGVGEGEGIGAGGEEAREKNASDGHSHEQQVTGGQVLLRMVTNHFSKTSEVDAVLSELPPWVAMFGKSTAPGNVVFFLSLRID